VVLGTGIVMILMPSSLAVFVSPMGIRKICFRFYTIVLLTRRIFHTRENRPAERCLSYTLGPVLAFDKVDYPCLRYLRQQTSNIISHTLPHRAYDLWTDRPRLPELEQEAINVQPLPTICFLNGSPEVSTEAGRVVGRRNRDLSKISVFGCDGLECHNDPFEVPRIELKPHNFESCRFREVDRS
jgi:hypothetical protein